MGWIYEHVKGPGTSTGRGAPLKLVQNGNMRRDVFQRVLVGKKTLCCVARYRTAVRDRL